MDELIIFRLSILNNRVKINFNANFFGDFVPIACKSFPSAKTSMRRRAEGAAGTAPFHLRRRLKISIQSEFLNGMTVPPAFRLSR